jgi:hypothetical protein
VTHLRKMLEELQRRNYSHHTVRAYVRIIRGLSAYFRRPPDLIGSAPSMCGCFRPICFASGS